MRRLRLLRRFGIGWVEEEVGLSMVGIALMGLSMVGIALMSRLGLEGRRWLDGSKSGITGRDEFSRTSQPDGSMCVSVRKYDGGENACKISTKLYMKSPCNIKIIPTMHQIASLENNSNP
jgi:hypothetical protein